MMPPRILKDESGQTLALVAAFMGLVALGFLAFGLDVGLLFREQRMAQAAADAAALAAAEELASGNTSQEQTVANAVAKLNGFDTTATTNPATVTLSTPSSGTFNGSGYVQATVSKPIQTFFLGAFLHRMATMPVSATSIAGGNGTVSQTCVCLQGSSGDNLNISNGSQLNANGCGIVDNSSSSGSFQVTGGSTLTAGSLGTVSTWSESNNVTGGSSITSGTTIVQGLSSTCAPTLPTAPSYTPASCVSDPGGSYGTFTFGPSSSGGTVCYKGLTVGANGSTVTLNPGTYVISSGTLHFESGSGGYSNRGGNGVFFYLTGTAKLAIDNGANVNLVAGGATESGGSTAPDLGSYNNVLIFQDPNDTSAMSLAGGSSTYLNGAMYAPAAAITVSNGSGATMKGAINASTLTVTGGSSITTVADANEGSITTGGSAKLVQ